MQDEREEQVDPPDWVDPPGHRPPGEPEQDATPPPVGIPADTNPEKMEGQTYDEYKASFATNPLDAASEAEWANAVEQGASPKEGEVKEVSEEEFERDLREGGFVEEDGQTEGPEEEEDEDG